MFGAGGSGRPLHHDGPTSVTVTTRTLPRSSNGHELSRRIAARAPSDPSQPKTTRWTDVRRAMRTGTVA